MALIYVVEDDKNIQEIETFALANVGYEVKGFDSATDFYAALNETAPDLILLDIMLPDEDGLSIVKKLRARQDTVLVPVIMVTAKTTEIDKVKGLDLGADDYITKPFGVMELISRVKAMLRRSQKTQEKDKVLKLGNIVLVIGSDNRACHYRQGNGSCGTKGAHTPKKLFYRILFHFIFPFVSCVLFYFFTP